MGRQWLQKNREINANKRGKLFNKLVREIAVAAKPGVPDPAHERAPGAWRSRPRASSRCPTTRSRAPSRRARACWATSWQLRAGHLRGLRAAQRAGDRRVHDRQPQPHRARHPRAVPQGAARREGDVPLRPHRASSRPRTRRRGSTSKAVAIEAGAQNVEPLEHTPRTRTRRALLHRARRPGHGHEDAARGRLVGDALGDGLRAQGAHGAARGAAGGGRPSSSRPSTTTTTCTASTRRCAEARRWRRRSPMRGRSVPSPC